MAYLNTYYQNMHTQMSSSNGDFDYQSLISQFGSMGLSELTGNDWGAGWFLQALQSGDTGSIIQSGANVVQNLFADMCTDDVPKANKTNGKDEDKIEDTKAKTKELFSSVDKSLQTIMSACEGNASKIQDALKEIEKLGGNSGDIEKKRKELEDKVKTIKEQQEILNNPETKPEDRQKAIKTILGLVGEIKVMADEIVAIKGDLEKQQKIVTESSKEVNELSEKMNEVVEQGSDDVANLTQENMQQIAEDTNKVSESVQKKALGTEQVATGTAMESGPQAIVTGSEGAQLIASGTSKIAGGAELMSGAVKDFKAISDIASNLQQGFTDFQSFAQGIGEYNKGITDLVGAFNTNIDPMIKSVGSWESVQKTNEALGKYTLEYAQAIGMTDVEADSNGTPAYNDDKKQDNLKNNVQYSFDMSAFDEAFKVKEA